MPEHYPLRDHRLNGEADRPIIASLIADDARATMLRRCTPRAWRCRPRPWPPGRNRITGSEVDLARRAGGAGRGRRAAGETGRIGWPDPRGHAAHPGAGRHRPDPFSRQLK